MPVDYSKWDALELSDDSDVEVHPNVDKKSFIRAKQNQIHQERAQRKAEIVTRKYERVINDGLLTRIDALLNALKKHAADGGGGENADEVLYQSVMETASDPAKDQPPPRPKEIDERYEEQPTYSKMMASLIDQVKKAVDERGVKDEDRLAEYAKEVRSHMEKVLDLQQQALKRLTEIEKLEGSKITSESLTYGFNSSHVAKADQAPPAPKPSDKTSSSVELLNKPTPGHAEANPALESGSEADEEDEDEDDEFTPADRTIKPSKLGNQFLRLPPNNYQQYLQFIVQNSTVLHERETDGLLMRAFDLQHAGNAQQSRHAVHQALLLQYCRTLGGSGSSDGVALFFKRIMTQGHQARKVFFDDVNSTYARLRDRDAEMTREAVSNGLDEEGEGVEQIQLHAVNPGQKITIGVPEATEPKSAEREIFEAFSPEMQKALESGDLDEVNKVLGKLNVEAAEAIVERLSEGGMLSMEEGIIDATTEEGRKQYEEYERRGKEGGHVEEIVEGEPGEAVDASAQGVEKLAVDEVD